MNECVPSTNMLQVEGMGRDHVLSLDVLYVTVVDAFVVSQRIEAAVHTFADVADRLAGWPHVHILYVALQPGEGRQAFVAWLASKVFHTWRQKGPH